MWLLTRSCRGEMGKQYRNGKLNERDPFIWKMISLSLLFTISILAVWLGVGTKDTEGPKPKMQWVAGALPLGLCVAMSMRVESRGSPLVVTQQQNRVLLGLFLNTVSVKRLG